MKKLIILFVLLLTCPCMATVPTGESVREYFADATETEYIFTQPCGSSDDILVYTHVVETGVEALLTITDDYTVAPTGGDYLNGGTVTLGAAPGAAYDVVIVRKIAQSQETAAGAITPTSVVAVMDRLTRMVNDLADRVDRSIHLQESDAATFDMELPGLSERAETYPYFNSSGVLTYVSSVTTGDATVSGFGATLIDDASAAAAATTLELGTTDAVEFAGITGTTGTFTGAIGAAGSITLGAGADLIGSGTSDITINTTKFTVAGATGNTAVGGTLGVTGVATLAKGSLLASTDAPTTDAMIANKKYVDDKTGTGAGTIKGWASVAANGTLLDGYNCTTARNSTGNYTITWGTDFANALYVVVGSAEAAAAGYISLNVVTKATGAAIVETRSISAGPGNVIDSIFNVIAIGDQ